MARRRKRSKKWISRLIFLILLVAAIVVCYFVWDAYFREKESPKIKEPETQIVEQEKEEPKEEAKTEEEVIKDEVVQYDGENPNQNEVLTGVITYLGVSGSDLMVRVNIDQYLTSGSCEINIVKGSNVLYTELVPVVGSVATATCEGFNVPVAQLEGGKLQVTINVSADEKTGTISGEVEI